MVKASLIVLRSDTQEPAAVIGLKEVEKWETVRVPALVVYLEDAGAVGSPPGVQQVVLPRAHEPFTCRHSSTSTLILNPQPPADGLHDGVGVTT